MGSINVSRARMKCRVFVDFDGTIAPVDTTDLPIGFPSPTAEA
jgi:hypothetical protein